VRFPESITGHFLGRLVGQGAAPAAVLQAVEAFAT
jgi:hypothetical protein